MALAIVLAAKNHHKVDDSSALAIVIQTIIDTKYYRIVALAIVVAQFCSPEYTQNVALAIVLDTRIAIQSCLISCSRHCRWHNLWHTRTQIWSFCHCLCPHSVSKPCSFPAGSWNWVLEYWKSLYWKCNFFICGRVTFLRILDRGFWELLGSCVLEEWAQYPAADFLQGSVLNFLLGTRCGAGY